MRQRKRRPSYWQQKWSDEKKLEEQRFKNNLLGLLILLLMIMIGLDLGGISSMLTRFFK
jgi:hypothetical protein